jgi:hypothetical protein
MRICLTIPRVALFFMFLCTSAHSLKLSDKISDWLCAVPDERLIPASELELVFGYGLKELDADYFLHCVDNYALTLSFATSTISEMGRACATVRIVTFSETD